MVLKSAVCWMVVVQDLVMETERGVLVAKRQLWMVREGVRVRLRV